MLGNISLKELLKRDNDFLVLISDRGGHKSTDIQLELFEQWQEKQKPLFVVTRPKSDETIGANWFSEYSRGIIEGAGYEIGEKNIPNFPKAKMITLNDLTIGFVMYASLSNKYKSNYFDGFETVEYIILEECVEENEASNYKGVIKQLMSIGSTVCRKNKRRFLLLGNDIVLDNKNPSILDELGLWTELKYNEIVRSEYHRQDDYKKDGIYKVDCWYFGDSDIVPNFMLPIGDIYALKETDTIIKSIPEYTFRLKGEIYYTNYIQISKNPTKIIYVSKNQSDYNLQDLFIKELGEFLKTDDDIRLLLLREYGVMTSPKENALTILYQNWLNRNNKRDSSLISVTCDFDKFKELKGVDFFTSSDYKTILNFRRFFEHNPVCYQDRAIKSLLER